MDTLYTSYDLYYMITNVSAKRGNSTLQKDRLINFCKNAGVIIKFIKKQGNNNLYQIVENNLNLQGEIWVDCYILSDFYEVSNMGRVRRKDNKQLLGTEDKKRKYIDIKLTDPNTDTVKNNKAHRLIYFSFNKNLLSDNLENITIDHINGIRNDNRLDNLRALTLIDNNKEKEKNQKIIKTLTTQLIVKYGYEKTKEKLEQLLNEY